MAFIIWIFVYSIGLITFIASITLYARDKTKRSLYQSVLLISFLAHTCIYSFPIITEISFFESTVIFSILIQTGLILAFALALFSWYVSQLKVLFWVRRVSQVLSIGLSVLTILVVIFFKDLIPYIFWIAAIYLGIIVGIVSGSLIYFNVKRSKSFRGKTIISLISGTFSLILMGLMIWSNDFLQENSLAMFFYLGFYGIINSTILVNIVKKILSSINGPGINNLEPQFKQFNISAREQDVYVLLDQGLSYKEIAFNLHISLSTVKTHIDRLFKKVGVNNKVELINKIKGK
jgi:DNA-binding CsgD family transcriptional regulator